jgi:1-acyl-sn-glycerol-3-phosphate acyltransferase
MSTLVYWVLRAVLRVALAVYFSRIELEGEEDVPEGPIVIAATHPNAFIDVALVGTRLRRRVHFVAKAGLFKNPIARVLLRALGAVPVERRKDRDGAALEADAQDKNARSLAACEEAVAHGGAVLIFPEGTSEQLSKLLPLKTGVARIALGAERMRERNGAGQQGVSIVPVSVRYDDPTSFRSRARVRFLPPIPVAPFAEMADEPGAVRALTGAVRDALEPTVVHVEDDALAGIVKEVDEIYGHAVTPVVGARLAAAPAIALAVNAYAKTAPARVQEVKEKIARYRGALAAAGLDDSAVRPLNGHATIGQDVAIAFGLPVAAWGILHHWLPYQLPRIVAAAFVKDETFISTIKLATGTIVFIALYVLEGIAWSWFFGPLVGVLVACSLPISGVVALEVIEAFKARGRRRRRRQLRARTKPETLRELEGLRAAVVSELDRARAEFLLSRDEPHPEDGLA